jgi:hypothetical protein
MSSTGLVYHSSAGEACRAAGEVLEVDGIPVNMVGDEMRRVGLFSIKEYLYEEENLEEDFQVSSDRTRAIEVEWFYETSPLMKNAFYPYDEARHWSHP